MRQILTLVALFTTSGCFFDSMAEGSGVGLGSESSSGSDSESDGSTTVADTASTESTGLGPSTDSGSTGMWESTGSVEDDDFALRFDGDESVTSMESVAWTATDFTVEMWIEILDEGASGDLIDLQQPGSPSKGWALQIGPGTQALTFVMHSVDATVEAVVGPTVDEIGLGWHHVAAVRHDTMARLFVDGDPVATRSIDPPLSASDVVASIGHSPTAGSAWSLSGVVIDDVHAASSVRYEGSFDPPVTLQTDEDSVIALDCDEGQGVTASDAASGLVFSVEASWVPGNEGQ